MPPRRECRPRRTEGRARNAPRPRRRLAWDPRKSASPTWITGLLPPEGLMSYGTTIGPLSGWNGRAASSVIVTSGMSSTDGTVHPHSCSLLFQSSCSEGYGVVISSSVGDFGSFTANRGILRQYPFSERALRDGPSGTRTQDPGIKSRSRCLRLSHSVASLQASRARTGLVISPISGGRDPC